jgi:hypothetical protein
MTDEPNSNRAPDAALDVTAESDVLAFFYCDSVSALQRLRDDAARLAGFADRLGRLVREAGVAATATHRREFHHAVRAFGRTSDLTGRLIGCLDMDAT